MLKENKFYPRLSLAAALLVYTMGAQRVTNTPSFRSGMKWTLVSSSFHFNYLNPYLFCKIRFFGTITRGGASHLWLGCDISWNYAVLAMAMVRLLTTSYWCLSIDTVYSTIRELKRIASWFSVTFVLKMATKYMLWK